MPAIERIVEGMNCQRGWLLLVCWMALSPRQNCDSVGIFSNLVLNPQPSAKLSGFSKLSNYHVQCSF